MRRKRRRQGCVQRMPAAGRRALAACRKPPGQAARTGMMSHSCASFSHRPKGRRSSQRKRKPEDTMDRLCAGQWGGGDGWARATGADAHRLPALPPYRLPPPTCGVACSSTPMHWEQEACAAVMAASICMYCEQPGGEGAGDLPSLQGRTGGGSAVAQATVAACSHASRHQSCQPAPASPAPCAGPRCR